MPGGKRLTTPNELKSFLGGKRFAAGDYWAPTPFGRHKDYIQIGDGGAYTDAGHRPGASHGKFFGWNTWMD